MTSRFLMLPLLMSALMASVLGQTIWIVDPDNGPGSSFTDLQPAVNAALPGDTIHVVYRNGFSHNRVHGAVINKALTVTGLTPWGGVGIPGPSPIFGRIEIVGYRPVSSAYCPGWPLVEIGRLLLPEYTYMIATAWYTWSISSTCSRPEAAQSPSYPTAPMS